MGDHHHSTQRHSIHLGTAWEPPTAGAGGQVVWTRRFTRPGGLGADEKVLLVFTEAAVTASVVLNAVRLPQLSPDVGRWEHDITPVLRARNELMLSVSSAARQETTSDAGQRGRARLPSVVGRVTLEIIVSPRAADHRREA